MNNTWILVANASIATLYNFKPKVSPKEKINFTVVENFSHPESRLKDVNITSDRLGEYVTTGGGHGNFVEQSDPHQYEAAVFARELCKKLEQGRTHNQYGKLILVATPHFLGLLRGELDKLPLNNISVEEIHKDYTKMELHELIDLLNLHS